MPLQLGNSNNWLQVYSQLHKVTEAPNVRGYYPIPDVRMPVVVSSGLVAIACNSQEVEASWWLAARLRVDLANPPAQTGEVTVQRTNLPVNRPATLVQLPSLDADLALIFEIPYWHLEMSITVWEYVGPDEFVGGVVYVP